MQGGYLALLLHAHLPYVHHPEHARFLEENWLFEAITECYIPLLQRFERLRQERVAFRLTLSLSPTLIGMLQDELLQQRYLQQLGRQIQLATKEARRKHPDPRTQVMAAHYLQLFEETQHLYTSVYQQDLIGAFGRLQRSGQLELITTAATHGFLPLLRTEPGSIRAQLEIASETYQETFGRPSPGIWLPECGYYRGLEALLKEFGFRYFVLDTHGLLHASERPWLGIAAPIACPNGVAAFARDPDSSRQVWSSQEGYPGDPWYREFHRDIGYERPAEQLAPLLPGDGSRAPTGIKYFRVTQQGEGKQPYEPNRAAERVQVHAVDFLKKRLQAFARLGSQMQRPPLLLAPYDAELFGHWWFEGPQWLEQLIRLSQQRPEIELITPSEYLQRHPTLQSTQPSSSSWGAEGYNAYWLNEHNDWLYPHLHRAARQMQAMAVDYAHEPPGTLRYRALQQAARSLLLAQASDWPFMLKSGAGSTYAEQRIHDLLARFHYLWKAIREETIEPLHLRALEQLDAIFPHIDFRSFTPPE